MSSATVTKLPAKKGKPRIETIIVTPEMAMELLTHNTINRPLRQQHVQRLTRQIVEGKWRFNGDTIKVSRDGDVLDGQHRLWAIIEAKMAVETVIVYGVDRDAFATIDTLRASRNGADILALNGVERYRSTIATALSWLLRWQSGEIVNYKNARHRIENSDVEAAFVAHPAIVQAVEQTTNLRGVFNPAILAFLYYIFSNRDAALAERMMETLRNPVSVPISDPFLRLRQYFLGTRHERRDALVSIALAIKAANFAKQDRKIQALNWRSTGPATEAFPTLEF